MGEKLTFARDGMHIMKVAYAGAMNIVLDTYPDVHTEPVVIEAVAAANWDQVWPQLNANGLRSFETGFRNAFCLGYRDASQFIQEKPDQYKELLKLTEDERVPVLMSISDGWSRFIGEFAMQQMKTLPARKKKPFRIKRPKH